MKMIGKFKGHLCVVLRHKWEVGKLLWRLGLYKQAIMHDMSKFSPTEFIPGVKYFTGNRSPIDNEKDDIGYSYAWFHHKGRNPHHWEYWIDNLGPTPRKTYAKYTPNVGKSEFVEMVEYVSQPTPVEIPYKYVLEMICDWVGAGIAYKSKVSPYDYFMQVDQSRIFHPRTHKLLVKFLETIRDEGIDGFIGVVDLTEKDYDEILEYYEIN